MENNIMPSPLTAKTEKRKEPRRKAKRLEAEYSRFFVPTPSPLWPEDDINFSLEQPSPLKVVPSETTYGILVPCLPNSTAHA
jgi:hypothetical protein